ncbi:MAG TPA: RHS repeat-associated core domain-containing protein [Acidimicrobiales bacterium]|nr:RHS repeat-associated core domain-containing protein [Acidimicrobiales bacterium]
MAGNTVTGAYADGVEFDAWFNQPKGIASDGTALFVTDENRRLRKLVPAAPPARTLPTGTTTVELNPAATTTVAGNSTSANTDGTGTGASFHGYMGGVAIHGGNAYVATTGHLRKVELATGATTTVAGSTTTGCSDGATGAASRFALSPGQIATDGVHIYSICYESSVNTYLRRTSIATGATATLPGAGTGLVLASDGFLYTTRNAVVYRVSPQTGAVTTFATAPSGLGLGNLAADDQALYIVAGASSNHDQVLRVSLADGTVDTLLPSSAGITNINEITSAGAFVYVTASNQHRVVRIAKANGAWAAVAGNTSNGAYADGVEFDAWFNQPKGIASDGTALFVMDENRRLRKLVPAAAPTRTLPTGTTTVELNPAATTTVAGNSGSTNTDGTGTAASFHGYMGGVAVHSGNAYVATTGHLRKVELATGATTTVAGSPTTGCNDGATGATSRFALSPGQIATDGVHIYSICYESAVNTYLRRTSIATGATATLPGAGTGLVLASDGFLYTTRNAVVYRVSPQTGAVTTFATVPSAEASSISSLAADDQALYLVAGASSNNDRVLRMSLADGTVNTLLPSSAGITNINHVASAGAFVYVTTSTQHGVVRLSKATGAWGVVAGNTWQGAYADGVEFEAWFNQPKGIASDGSALFVIDENRRLRKLTPAPPVTRTLPISSLVDLNVDTGYVLTYAGNGDSTHVDGNTIDSSFHGYINGITMAGTSLYVAETGYLRHVDLLSGAVTTLAGSTNYGCNDGSASNARFGLSPGQLANDGAYIYSTCQADTWTSYIRRTSRATGATITLSGGGGAGLVLAPDGYLYSSGRTTVQRIDPHTGATTAFATLPTELGSSFGVLAADIDALWVIASGATNGDRVLRISLADGSISTLLVAGAGGWPTMQGITSAGAFLYATTGSEPHGVLRIDKATGGVTHIAGSSPPPDMPSYRYSDGHVDAAKFYSPTGILSDGANLWIADQQNRRLRVLTSDGSIVGGVNYAAPDAYAGSDGDVNTGAGAFTTTHDDLKVAGAGPDLDLTRSYGSRDTRTGPFGVGWHHTFGGSWRKVGDTAISVTYGNGRTEVHSRRADGTYATANGYHSTLTAVGQGFVLETRDRARYHYAGDGKLTAITDPNNRQLTLTYNGSGRLVTVAAAGGRALTFAWEGSHIVSASTNAVSAHGGPLTWRYYYAGDNLVKACDPRDNAATGSCIVYTYTGGKITKVARPKGNVEAEAGYRADGRIDWRQDGVGDRTRYEYPSPQVTRVVDARTNVTVQEFDVFYRLVKETDPAGKVTTYSYDGGGNQSHVVKPNGATTVMGYDSAGNPTSVSDGLGNTTYSSYDAAGNLLARRDARSTSSGDDRYKTAYTYDSAGNRLTETGPPTADFPAGVGRRWTYTTAGEPAVGGGTTPAGLLRTETDARGKTTSYRYNSVGDVVEKVQPEGLRTTWSYDELGRRTAETVFSDAVPSGAATTFAYDRMGSLVERLEPSTTNPVIGTAAQRRTRVEYDANGNQVKVTVDDTQQPGSERVTTHAYDNADRELSATDAQGGTVSRTYDPAGNVATVTDQEGRVVQATYDNRNLRTAMVLKNFVDDPDVPTAPRDVTLATFAYDENKRRVDETDALGRTTRTQFDKADRVLSRTLLDFDDRTGGTSNITLETYGYDGIGGVVNETRPGRSTTHTYDQAGRRTLTVVDPAGVNRRTTFNYDEAGNLVRAVLSEGSRVEERRFSYDNENHRTSETVENGTTDLTTTTAFDERGFEVRRTSPRGNLAGADAARFTTEVSRDAFGRVTQTVAPLAELSEDGTSTTTGRPTTVRGYDAFGNATHDRDARNALVVTSYDKLDRRTTVQHPSYTRADGGTLSPAEHFTYDKVGNLLTSTDRRGSTTTYRFDKRNRSYLKLDPLLPGEAAQGTTRTEFDAVGNPTKVTDPRGATVERTFDDRNQLRTETEVVRQAGGATARHTTTFDYDDRGNPTYVRSPLGHERRSEFSPLDELVKAIDALGKETHSRYVAGRVVEVTDPLGHRVVRDYDLAGRPTSESRFAAGSSTPLVTAGTSYDADGNVASTSSAEGRTTTLSHDGLGRLSSVTETGAAGVPMTTAYTYDANGNPTRTTNGRGAVTTAHYSAWNQIEHYTEPATSAHPDVADRRYTTLYDNGGLPVEQRQPGGISIARSYDVLGLLRTETGTGPGTPSAVRTFGYDRGGLRTTASHPNGTITLAWDDRRLLQSVGGPAGSSSYVYDADERLVHRDDPAGGHDFTWTSRSELSTATDPLTGTTRSYQWDDAGRLAAVAYGPDGAPRPQRTLAWDALNRLTADTLVDVGGAQQARHAYTYDDDGNVLTQSVDFAAGAANAEEGTHQYRYDGAGRLAGWTRPNGADVAYGYDAAGNRTSAGADTFAYDERNRLVSGPQGAYTWTPRGTLASVTSGTTTTTHTFDALNRAVAAGSTAYEYDALDRIASRDGLAFGYAGLDLDPTHDGSQTYSHAPSGDLLAWSDGSAARLVGENRHGDLAYLFGTTGTVEASRVFEPYGKVVGEAGTLEPSRAFQSDWTDPASGEVWMGARWYDPDDAVFTARDTYAGAARTPVSLNRYTYANGDPMEYFDPDGRKSKKKQQGDISDAEADYWLSMSPEQRDAEARLANVTLLKGVGLPKPPQWDGWSSNERKRWMDRNWAERAVPIQDCSYACEFKKNTVKTFKTVAKVGLSVAAGAACTAVAGVAAGAVCAGMAYRAADNAMNGRPIMQGVFSAKAIVRDAVIGIGTAGLGRLAAPAFARLGARLGIGKGGTIGHAGGSRLRAGSSPKGGASTTHRSTPAPNTARGPDFVAGPIGSAPPVPISQSRMAAGLDDAGFPRQPTTSPGMDYTLPDGSHVRLMDPAGTAGRRASFTNANGQPINPFTGKPVQPPPGLTPAERLEYVRVRTHVEQGL